MGHHLVENSSQQTRKADIAWSKGQQRCETGWHGDVTETPLCGRRHHAVPGGGGDRGNVHRAEGKQDEGFPLGVEAGDSAAAAGGQRGRARAR